MTGGPHGKNVRWKSNTDRAAELSHCFIAINPEMFADGFTERMSDMLAEMRNTEPVSDTSVCNNHIFLSLSLMMPSCLLSYFPITFFQGFSGPTSVSFHFLEYDSLLSLSNCPYFPLIPLMLAVKLVYYLLPRLKWSSKHEAVSFHSLHSGSNNNICTLHSNCKFCQVKYLKTLTAGTMS